MYRRRWWSVLLALALAGSLSGCGRLLTLKGTIHGSVVDQNGLGITGAIVTLAGSSITVQSNNQGNFTLNGVPAGPQSLTITKDGFRASATTEEPYTLSQEGDQYYVMHGSDKLALTEAMAAFGVEQASSHATMQVNVPRGGTIQAQATLQSIDSSAIDNVMAYYSSPEPGANLTIGNTVTFRVDAQYSLVTATSGKLLYALIYKTSNGSATLAATQTLIDKNSNVRPLTFKAQIPSATNTLMPVLLLVNSAGHLLASSFLNNYNILNGTALPTITAPTLSLKQVSHAGVELTWEASIYQDFAAYIISRNGANIASFTNPNTKSYTDTLLLEGDKVNYQVTIKYGPSNYPKYIDSDDLVVNVPGYGMSQIEMAASVSSLVADPQRPYVYGNVYASNQLIRISTSTDTIDKTLQACPGPSTLQISADNTKAVTACAKGDTVALVDLATFTVAQVIRGIANPVAAAIDSANYKLYVMGGSSTQTLYTYELGTSTVTGTKTVTDGVRALHVSVDGAYIYCIYDNKVDVVRVSDMVVAKTLSSNTRAIVDPGSNRIFIGNNIYQAATPWSLLATVSDKILGIAADGSRIVTKNSNYYDAHYPYLNVLTFDGANAQTQYSFYVNKNYAINAVAMSGEKVYASRWISGKDSILITDLAQR